MTQFFKSVFTMFFGDRYKFVYWVIAFATAQHTAWGAATTMQGPQPQDAMMWWLQGAVFAIAIDFMMVAVATKIRSGVQTSHFIGFKKMHIPINWYVVTFLTLAIVSFYFQLLYAWAHAEPLQQVGGVAQIWIDRLQGLIEARIVIAPLALPAVATLYTFGGFGKGGEVQPKQRTVNTVAQMPMQPLRNDAISIAKMIDEQPAIKQLPATIPLRGEDGKLHGYRCPGCGKDLSISGWSRHKSSCVQYIEVMNGTSK